MCLRNIQFPEWSWFPMVRSPTFSPQEHPLIHPDTFPTCRGPLSKDRASSPWQSIHPIWTSPSTAPPSDIMPTTLEIHPVRLNPNFMAITPPGWSPNRNGCFKGNHQREGATMCIFCSPKVGWLPEKGDGWLLKQIWVPEMLTSAVQAPCWPGVNDYSRSLQRR